MLVMVGRYKNNHKKQINKIIINNVIKEFD